jgi:cobyrinic acid a,c-diamide synthase
VKAVAPIPIVVIAGVASGVGKTTLTLGLLESMRRRGLCVQAFKVGPDFIDPGFHALATGRAAYTLDGWMCGRERVIETVACRAADADLAVVEGMMGCFDGLDGETDEGSTSQVAKWLGAPVVLMVDAGALARSAGAVVLGFERFDPDLSLDGVVFNRAGGAPHRRWLTQAVESACRARVLGALPHALAAALPERHLGLITAAEGGYSEVLRDKLAALVEEHVEVDTIIAMARSTVRRCPPAPSAPARRARIAVARDQAFQFYYAENLDLLRGAGAELVFWSPLADPELPDADGLYLGGGYPELHASRLAANAGMRRAIRKFAESGRPVYAECGGLMYLCDSLEDAGGAAWPMVGVLRARARWTGGPLCLGYREVETQAASLLGPAGTRVRGHEFHCSSLEPAPASATCVYRVEDGLDGSARSEGYAVGGALMSYVHLHWGSNPGVADRFVEACRR